MLNRSRFLLLLNVASIGANVTMSIVANSPVAVGAALSAVGANLAAVAALWNDVFGVEAESN